MKFVFAFVLLGAARAQADGSCTARSLKATSRDTSMLAIHHSVSKAKTPLVEEEESSNATHHADAAAAHNETIGDIEGNETKRLCRTCAEAGHSLMDALQAALAAHAAAEVKAVAMAEAKDKHEASSKKVAASHQRFQDVFTQHQNFAVTYKSPRADFDEIIRLANSLPSMADAAVRDEAEQTAHQEAEATATVAYQQSHSATALADEKVAAARVVEEEACKGLGLPPLAEQPPAEEAGVAPTWYVRKPGLFCVGKNHETTPATFDDGLPLWYKLGSTLDECEATCDARATCIAIGWEADRSLCYNHFTTSAVCDAAQYDATAGWHNSCSRTGVVSGPDEVFGAAAASQDDGSSTHSPYTCQVKQALPEAVECHKLSDFSAAGGWSFSGMSPTSNDKFYGYCAWGWYCLGRMITTLQGAGRLQLDLGNALEIIDIHNHVRVLVNGDEIAKLGRREYKNVVVPYADGDNLEIVEHFGTIDLKKVTCMTEIP